MSTCDNHSSSIKNAERSRILIVIPAYNEEMTIAQVISETLSRIKCDVAVVDDDSRDRTAQIAKLSGAMVIPLSVRMGSWGATQTGLRYAKRHDYDIVVTMDADGQHAADELPELINAVITGNADVIIGSCLARGSFLRKVAWGLLRNISGLKLQDLTSGLRVYNSKAIDELSSWRATMLEYQDVGVLLLLQSIGIKIDHLPVSMRPRKYGKSQIFHSWTAVISYMVHTLVLGLAKRKK